MRQFAIYVKPGSKLGPLIEADISGDMTIYLRERPVDTQANPQIVRMIAEHLMVPKNKVQIIRGEKTRQKLIRVND